MTECEILRLEKAAIVPVGPLETSTWASSCCASAVQA
jgi:hypothetical protein